MAQRRSKNRRLSARRSNVSGFLNEDTNVYDNDDPLWFDRTAVRPSTSLRLSKHTTAMLDPDSTVHASQLSDNWFENLSRSDSSKLMEEVVRRRANKENEEPADSDRVSAATESESEHEVRKKRANLRAIRKPSQKIDKSNAFMKALEKTTDSHTRNLTHAQMLEGNESESTHDDSRTVMKVRPKFTRRAQNDTNNFEKALESDSASERASTSRRSLRSSKRISEVNEGFATPEKQMRLRRSVAEKIDNVSVEKMQNKSVNRTKGKSVAESSARELRNRSVNLTVESSSTKKRSSVDESPDVSSSSPEVKKQRHHLFSQGNKSGVNKSKGEKSAFEVALDSVNDSGENQATVTEEVNTSNRNEQNEAQEEEEEEEEEVDDSDSSSIPQNIRRTRSRSFFGERKSGETGDVNASKRKSRNSSRGASQSSKNESVDRAQTSRTNLTIDKSSDEEEIFSVSFNRSKPAEQEKSNMSVADKSQKSSVETSDSEDMVEESPSKSKRSARDKSEKTESGRLQVSSVESTDDEDMINMSPSKAAKSKVDVSSKSTKSNGKADESKPSDTTTRSLGDDKEEEAPPSPPLNNRRSRSRLFQKKNASKETNAFDQMSFNESSVAMNKSKEQEIEETPKASQRSPRTTNKSQKNQSADVSKNKSASRENSKADVTDDETSTIAQHIRRTRSRLFQKSRAADDDNAFEKALEADDVPTNRSVLSQKSQTLNKSTNRSTNRSTNKSTDKSTNKSTNKSVNNSHSAIRDATAQRSIVDMLKKKPRIILDKIIQPADSAGLLGNNSYEENQENRHPNVGEPSGNKEKTMKNSQVLSEQRSVETSSDGTPAPQSPRDASTPFPAPPITVARPSKRASTKPSPAKSAQNSTFDDLLHTPNPAQSTLIARGKPVNRITQFSFTSLGERTPLAVVEPPKAPSAVVPDGENKDDDDVDVTGESDVSDYPLLSRKSSEIPQDREKSTLDEDEAAPVVSKSPKKKSRDVLKQKNTSNNTNEIESSFDWEKAKKHTDAIKMMVDAQLRLAEEARKKRELEKQRIDVKFKRLQAQREAEAKRKNKKPIDKAFLVDGKVYKQPKLPRPKPWATDKLYKYLHKLMEPKFGIRTRVKSEEFVLQLSDFATRISKRKKFENYATELDELMINMARLGIIETKYDFYRFAADFMPYSFREKVNPIAVPGNRRNIPYDPQLVYRPLLEGLIRESQSDSDES